MMHTPGPWHIEDDHIVPADLDASGFYCIAKLFETDQRFANGYLIAAAPDMLATLKWIVNRGDKASAEVARAAIAKAEGR